MLKIVGKLEKEKPTILLLAGSLVSPEVFSQVECPEGWQMAAVDYCLSDSPWDVDSLGQRLANLVEKFSLFPVILAGYSAGGVVIMSAASKAPMLFDGLLLSNTGPSSKGHGNPNFPQELLDKWGNEEFFTNFITVCFSRPVPPVLQAHMLKYMNQVDKQAGYMISYSLRQIDYREDLKQYRGEVRSEEHTSRTMAHVEMMKQSMPQAEVILLNGGHTVMVEDKDGWQQALNGLVKRVEAKAKR